MFAAVALCFASSIQAQNKEAAIPSGSALLASHRDAVADGISSDSSGTVRTALNPDGTKVAAAPDSELRAGKYMTSQQCESGEIPKSQCKMNWWKATVQALEVTAFDNAYNMVTDSWVRGNVLNQKDFFGHWFQSVENFRFSRWSNDDWFSAAYIAHPIQGAIFNYTWIQNDPSGMSLELENSRRYWHSRLRALEWSTFWTLQWRFGPLSESSLGNTGLYTYYSKDLHRYTNDTGFVTLVTTPIGGAIWGLWEDAVDKYAIKKWEARNSHPAFLLGLCILTPARTFANFTRFKPLWYRDSRPVKARIHREARMAQQAAGDDLNLSR